MAQDRTNTAGVIAPPPLLFAAVLTAGLVLHWAWPVRILATGPASRAVVALPFLICSAILAILSYEVMRRRRTPVNPGKPTVALVVEGPYRYTRNPLYLSLLLLYAAIAALINSLWVLLLLPVLFAVYHLGVVAREEKYLERKFDQAYLQYKGKVRRWI